MFAKVKTGTKILGGFGIAIAIAAVVGIVGYWGIGKLGGHVDEIGLVRMPSVEAIQQIKSDSETIKAAIRTLLNDSLAPDIRKRQHDNLLKARERYEAAWKVYEALPHTAEEEALWKQLVPAWEEWRKENNEYFRLNDQFTALIERGSKQRQSDKLYVDALREAMALAKSIDQAFSLQVHEWKDVLIRGNDAEKYAAHLAGFVKAEKIVEQQLPKLKELMPQIGCDPQAVGNLETLHTELGAKYREALKSFDKANPEAGRIIDKQVTGIDRPFTAAAETLFASLTETQNKVDALLQKMQTQAMTACRDAQLKACDLLDKISAINVNMAAESVQAAKRDAARLVWTMVAVIGAGAVLLSLLGIVLAKSIGRVLNTLIGESKRLTEAAVAGKLQTRGNPELVGFEFRPIVEGVNATLDAVIGPLNVAAEYVDRISKGDIPAKITDNYNGDFNEIKNNLNQCIDAVNALVADANVLSDAAIEGRLDTRADAAKHHGDFRKIVQGVNDTIDSLVGHIDAMPAPAMIVDKDFTVQYMNQTGADVIGLSKQQIVGTKCYDHFKTPHCNTGNCACGRAMQEGRPSTARDRSPPRQP